MQKTTRQRSWYPGYVLLITGLVSVMNYYDRSLLMILVEPVKRDLHLSDGQIGILIGFGFALMYSLLGIPMARIADRWGRARLLACVAGFWSVMTAASGTAVNFTTLLLARMGVAVGEAGGLPAVHALVAEYFSAKRRGLALSLIGVSGALGIALALALGGLIADHWGWRAAFFVAGAPGIVLAAIVYLTIRDPARPAPAASSPVPAAMPLGLVAKTLWRRRSFILMCTGVAIAAIGAYAWQAWTPAFLMRTYGLTAGEVGLKYSAVTGPVSIISVLTGGLIHDWLLRRDQRWPLWILALSFGISTPLHLSLFLINDFSSVLVLAVFSTFVGGLWTGPAYAIVQSLAGPKLRALCAAVLMMLVNIIGLGLGPVIPGLLSDALKPRFGTQSLMVSLCLMAAFTIAAIIPFLIATRTYARDVEEANR